MDRIERPLSQKHKINNEELDSVLFKTPLYYDDPECRYTRPSGGVMIPLDSKFAKQSIQNVRNQFMPKPQKAPFDFETFQNNYITRLNMYIESKHQEFRPPQLGQHIGYSLISPSRKSTTSKARQSFNGSSSTIGSRPTTKNQTTTSRKQEWRQTQHSKKENAKEIMQQNSYNEINVQFQQDNSQNVAKVQNDQSPQSPKSQQISEQVTTQTETTSNEQKGILNYNIIQVSMNIQK